MINVYMCERNLKVGILVLNVSDCIFWLLCLNILKVGILFEWKCGEECCYLFV